MQILYCDCVHSTIIPQDSKDQIKKALVQSGLKVDYIPDLCKLAAESNPMLKEISWAETIIIACYPRAVYWLLKCVGISIETSQIWNMKELSGIDIVKKIEEISQKNSDNTLHNIPQQTNNSNTDAPWIPWFPVLDYDRCCNCKQCLNFCLFGVYSQKEGKVTVKNPKSCKNNCPACARICPACAIIFPKCPETPLQGAPVPSDYKPTNLQQMLGSDPQKALHERRLKARNILAAKKKNN